MLHTSPMSQRLKRLVHEALVRKGMSQNQLAYRLGISTAAPSAWWKTGEVSRENMQGLSTELDIPIGDLYEALGEEVTPEGGKNDPLIVAFTEFVPKLAQEDREIVTALLEVASRTMTARFAIDETASPQKDVPTPNTVKSQQGAAHGNASDRGRPVFKRRRLSRVRDSE